MLPGVFLMITKNYRKVGILIVFLVIFLDQVTKWWVLNIALISSTAVALTDFFNLVIVWNSGASFGIFSDGPDWVRIALILFAAIICIILLIWLMQSESNVCIVALGLIIGGAVGNSIDRIRFGSVLDFLDIHIGHLHWPAFNIADSGITIGVALLIFDSLKPKRLSCK